MKGIKPIFNKREWVPKIPRFGSFDFFGVPDAKA
jgi:hypothetical protein